MNEFYSYTHYQHQKHTVPNNTSLPRNRLIVNLSESKLTEEQQKVLELGLNLSSTPKDILRFEIITRTEDLARKIKSESEAQT